ncbi:CrcB family protein [Streptomyces sp. RFCAC02]|uniref:FluC/FEX family fluoride channel n=1 Tax=Streptomyces sp. RFCAC02 TaxID=2499143 RepID=UPI00102227B4|nr:CrcB family protein [Streptomyces sp. RFCAC02]
MNAPSQWPVVAAVSVGGAIGACGRYGAGLLWSTPAPGFPWTTLLVNITGCAAMGVLMVLITDLRSPHRLVRPFLGTGILGGWTTFSTWSQDLERQLDDGRAAAALAYAGLTLAGALLAVTLAATGTRALIRHRETP